MIESIHNEEIVKIMNNSLKFNLDYSYSDIFSQPLVELDPYSAFNFFCSVRNSYFSTESFEQIKIRIPEKLSFNYPSILDYYKRYPFMFSGKKLLIPDSYTKSGKINIKNHLHHLKETLKKADINPCDCLFIEIYNSVEGQSMEDFVCFVASSLLINEGFLIENQPYIPSKSTSGIPDIMALKIPSIQKKLIEYNLKGEGGFLHELALLRFFKIEKERAPFIDQNEVFLVGEAKTGKTSFSEFNQKEIKYFNGPFTHFMQITPHRDKFEQYYTFVDFNSNGFVSLKWPDPSHKKIGEWVLNEQNALKEHLIGVIKDYLLNNLTVQELLSIENLKNCFTFYEIREKLMQMPLNDFLEKISPFIHKKIG